jgi:hypothetical protein
VVEQLLEKFTQLGGQDTLVKYVIVDAFDHLAQVLLLMWLGARGEVAQQQVTLVTPLQQACGVLAPSSAEPPVVQQAQPLSLSPIWGPIAAALRAVAAAIAAAASGKPRAGGSATTLRAMHEKRAQQCVVHLVEHIEHVVQLQAEKAGAGGDVLQLQQLKEQEEAAGLAAADALADMQCILCPMRHAPVEAALAGLCRQLLAAWLAALEVQQQELVDAVVHAVGVVAAGKHT